MNENLFKIILAVIPVLVAIITGFVIPYIKSKTNAEDLATIVKWVTYAVAAAELIIKGEKQGDSKKEFVLKFIDDLINKNKTIINQEQLNILIESAVKEMNNK